MEVHKKANLFVVGAMRAGTTSFMELLGQHPAIYVSPIKEPHFFIEKLPKAIFEPQPNDFLEQYFKKEFPKPIHRAHVTSIAEYTALFEIATSQEYLAEGSVSYLHEPQTASKIQHYNPKAKIIILLRDPIDRAYSHYLMNVGLGRENRTFETVITKELQQIKNGNLPWHSILNMSFYDTSVNRFKEIFDSVLVLTLKELSNSESNAFRKITDFLKISSFKTVSLPQRNAAIHFKNKQIIYTLKKTGFKGFLSDALSSKMKQKLVGALSQKNLEPLISEELESQLNDLFTERSKTYFEYSKFSK